jgi:hypothetical protein
MEQQFLTSNDVNLLPRVAFNEDVYTMFESDWIQQNCGDIVEQDTGLWEIRNFTNGLAYYFISGVRACHVDGEVLIKDIAVDW